MAKKRQPEADAELQRERKERGKLREHHLEAGRQRAADDRQAYSEAARVSSEQAAALNREQAGEEPDGKP